VEGRKREGKGRGGRGRERKGRAREGEGRGEEEGDAPPNGNSWIRAWLVAPIIRCFILLSN